MLMLMTIILIPSPITGDCKDEDGTMGRCVAGAIKNYTTQLLDYCKQTSHYNLTEALLFLSHFIGDIHQDSLQTGAGTQSRDVAEKNLDQQVKERDEKYSELDSKLNRPHKRAKQRIQEVQKALIKYPQAPQSDMVFISGLYHLEYAPMFECVKRVKNHRMVRKEGSEIDYDSLALGRLHEVREVFGRVVFDTVYPLNLGRQ